MISFREVLQFMETGQVFSCKVVTYDRKRKTGGEVKEYRAVLAKKDSDSLLTRPATKSEQNRASSEGRNPNHRHWYTRNIELVTIDDLATPIIRKIHIPLIIEFNDQQVTP